MHERARIARFFAPLTAGEPGSFGLTDDAAALTPPPGATLVVTTDSVIQGIHVLPDAAPEHYARKLVRRNLSDLAAMGAMPWRYTLNLHTPTGISPDWFAAFSDALTEEQDAFGMVLIGGDSTSGGEVVHTTMTCFGLADGSVLRRHGAQAGDDLYVSGTIGDAALGLQLLQHSLQQPLPGQETLVARYHTPQPRLALGAALQHIASAAIDISDGLLADITQLAATSGVGAQITRTMIPLSMPAQQMLEQSPSLWEHILHGGDDYELCFTAAPAMRERVGALAKSLELPITCIGTVTAECEVILKDGNGASLDTNGVGWEYS